MSDKFYEAPAGIQNPIISPPRRRSAETLAHQVDPLRYGVNNLFNEVFVPEDLSRDSWDATNEDLPYESSFNSDPDEYADAYYSFDEFYPPEDLSNSSLDAVTAVPPIDEDLPPKLVHTLDDETQKMEMLDLDTISALSSIPKIEKEDETQPDLFEYLFDDLRLEDPSINSLQKKRLGSETIEISDLNSYEWDIIEFGLEEEGLLGKKDESFFKKYFHRFLSFFKKL